MQEQFKIEIRGNDDCGFIGSFKTKHETEIKGTFQKTAQDSLDQLTLLKEVFLKGKFEAYCDIDFLRIKTQSQLNIP